MRCGKHFKNVYKHSNVEIDARVVIDQVLINCVQARVLAWRD